MEDKSKMDDYDGDDEGKTSSGTEEEDKERLHSQVFPNGSNSKDSIRKLLSQTSPGGSEECSKDPIDHVQSQPSLRLTTNGDQRELAHKNEGSMTSGLLLSTTDSKKLARTNKKAKSFQFDDDVTKIEQVDEVTGQGIKAHAQSLNARRSRPYLAILKSNPTPKREEDKPQYQRRVRKMSTSMTTLIGPIHSPPSRLTRRSSCGTGPAGFTGSLKSYRQHSANSSHSPSPSPLRRRNDLDPLTLRRLYRLHRNGISDGTTTGSKLNLPLSRPASIRSNRSANSSLKGRPTGPNRLSSSYYRSCRSNSFGFSLDFKNGVPLKDLPPRERRHRKVAYAVIICSSLLLLLAVLCIVISLHFSALGNKSGQEGHLNGTGESFIPSDRGNLRISTQIMS